MTASTSESLVAEFVDTWPSEWHADASISQGLSFFKDQLLVGRPIALPFVSASKPIVRWVIVAPTMRLVRDHFEDIKSWLPSKDRHYVTGEIVKIAHASGALTNELARLAPQGYGRWNAPYDRSRAIILRLAQMHRFLATKPEVINVAIPTLPSLRLAFISALSVGDWTRAESCVDEIDRWGLDQAASTLHMRIRLLETQGATNELFKLVCQQKAWDFSSPRRIAAAILNAVDAVAIEPTEQAHGIESAFKLFRKEWYPKLYQLVEEARSESHVARVLAMAATADLNRTLLESLVPKLSDDLAAFLLSQFPVLVTPGLAPPEPQAQGTSVSQVPSSPLSQGDFWTRLHAAIKSRQTTLARNLLECIDDKLLVDPNFLGLTSDGILEILSDPDIERDQTAHLLRQDALATLIDAFVGSSGFPRLDHLDCYLALLEGLASLNSESMSANESQLMLGLVGAVVHLSSHAHERCEDLVRLWWKSRPVIQRLDWLAGALDTLATVHVKPDRLWDLYVDGLTLADRRGLVFTPVQIRTWENIGRALELSQADISEALSPLQPPQGQPFTDPLDIAELRQIAIISLQEASAREAARELERRTGARVNVVISSVADSQLRHAKNADLILYVWAATSHAAYRTFDSVRERIEYVQGTGCSSIVLAAERWVERRSD